jgi:hypothetical protein
MIVVVQENRRGGGWLRAGCGCVVGLFALVGLAATVLVVVAAIAAQQGP